MMFRTALVTVIAAGLLSLSGIFELKHMYGKIHADAQGYYGYLVAVFIEQSFDWESVIAPYAETYFDGQAADFVVNSSEGSINKYYVGVAVLMLPFFLLSCLSAFLFGYPVDGYSEPFQHGATVAALFYSGMGIYFLARFIHNQGINKYIALFCSVLCLFATPLFHYSVSEPAMSHAYSFGLFGVFLYLVDDWVRNEKRKTLLLGAAVYALIILVRPVNGMIILSVPFIANGFSILKTRWGTKTMVWSNLFLAFSIVIGILLIQSITYLFQVGQPLVWSYKGEGFNFLNPEPLNFLFSYKKGLFVYTPIAFIGLLGVFWFAYKRRPSGLWLVAFLALSTYVLSSWWNWYYGASLGMRAAVEFMPFLAFGLAFLLQELIKPLRAVLILLCLGTVGLNLIQEHQYQKFILHWDDMTKERFWKVFLKTDRKYQGLFYRDETPLQLPSDEEIQFRVVFESDLEGETTWGNQGINTEKAYSGLNSTLVSGKNNYGTTLGVPVSEMGALGEKKLVITAMVWSSISMPDLTIAYSFRNDSSDYGHQYVSLGQFVTEQEQWIQVQTMVSMLAATDTADNWIVYPYTTGETDVYLDDIRYEVITLNPASTQP